MATDLTSLLENGVIIPSLEAKSRKQAIHALAEALAAATGLGAPPVVFCPPSMGAKMNRKLQK